jgi:hypothetical protein
MVNDVDPTGFLNVSVCEMVGGSNAATRGAHHVKV